MRTTKIELKNLAFFARHGVMKEEEALGQRFHVDVLVTLDPAVDPSADDPKQTLDYVALYSEVKDLFGGYRYKLIEACADAIAGGLLERFASITEARVAIRKPAVPVDCICDHFGAEVTRCR